MIRGKARQKCSSNLCQCLEFINGALKSLEYCNGTGDNLGIFAVRYAVTGRDPDSRLRAVHVAQMLCPLNTRACWPQ